MAVLEPPISDVFAPIEAPQIHWHSTPEDDAALAMVIQDAITAENYVQSRRWYLDWNEAELLYEAPYAERVWEGTKIPRAAITVPLVQTHVESLLPAIMGGLFSDDPPFDFEPRPGTKADAARANAAIVDYQLHEMGFREQMRLGVKSELLYGNGIWKHWYEDCTEKRTIWRRKAPRATMPDGKVVDTDQSDALTAHEITIRSARPRLEWINVKHILVDPGCRRSDIREANYVIHRMYMTMDEVEALRGFEGYDLPDKESLYALCFPPKEEAPANPMENLPLSFERDFTPTPRWEDTSADPELHKLEVLERWDNNKVITVLNRKLCIRNQENEYGRIPFLSAAFVDVLDCFWGIGLGRIVGNEQRVQQGIINTRLDEMALNLNGMYTRTGGENAFSQNVRMRPGGLINLAPGTELKPLERLPAVPEAYAEINASDGRAARASGANEMFVQGTFPHATGRSSATSTATGVSALTQASGARIQELVERLADQVVVPFLQWVIEMNAEKLPLAEVRRLLSEELQVAYEGDALDVLTARMSVDVLAASRLQARRAMAQSLPILAEMILSGPVSEALPQIGMKVDYNEFINMVFQVAGWRNKSSLIVPMTVQDEQRQAMNNPAVQQLIAQRQKAGQQARLQQQKLAQQHGQRMEQRDQDIAGEAWQQAQDHLLRGLEMSEMREGTPGSAAGFGDMADRS